MLETDGIIGAGSTLISGTVTAVQADTVFKWIGLVITILCGLFTLAEFIYNWWKNAKKDGKITKDEIKDLVDGTAKITKDTIDKTNKKSEDK